VSIDTDVKLSDYRQMLIIRTFEERILALRISGEISGSVHLCTGQEAGPVGACSELRTQDPLFATYRGHGWAIARGLPLEALFGELLGRSTGVNEGRGGSAYFTAPKYGFFGENSIVAAGLPIAVGAALAGRYDSSGRVALTVFGDGALNQGACHEAMNFASTFRLPVLFVCENNVYSEMTPIADMVVDPVLWHRAAAYGMPGERVDGNDPAQVRDAVKRALDRARNSDGPSFLELMTYRLVGHYVGDPQVYRTKEEVDEAAKVEPLVRLRSALLTDGVSESSLVVLESEITKQVETARDHALAAPLVDLHSVREHVYA
jgi:TPP-dependent pyruvate/acetoin dehydrogenase alpha subunit